MESGTSPCAGLAWSGLFRPRDHFPVPDFRQDQHQDIANALHRRAGAVELGADQQIRVAAEGWPSAPVNVDAQRAIAWLHRQIMFEREPLGLVASEFNRYTSKPIEVATPALRDLKISGVFATDDTEAFIAFLRSLPRVHVEVSATRIRVSQE